MSALLDQAISLDQLLSWDADKYYDLEKIKRILSKRHLTSASVALALDVHAAIGPCGSFWVIMRDELLSAKLIHRMSIDLGRAFLQFARDRDAYIDFRTPQFLDKKALWIDDAISLGDYRLASRRAEDARILVSELHDPLTSAAADVICHIAREDARSAFRSAFAVAREAAQSPAFEEQIIEDVRRRITHADVPESAAV